MAYLAEDRYGKFRVRLMKVARDEHSHALVDWTVNVLFRGDFESCFVAGDNSRILPTDTMKNSVYSRARASAASCMEEFGIELANYFIENNPQVSEACIEMGEKAWKPAMVNGLDHPTTFLQDSQERQTTRIVQRRESAPEVSGGLSHMIILKTANSKFEGFLKDSLTTLRETDDRLFGTEVACTWSYYRAEGVSFQIERRQIRNSLIAAFAEHKSLSVQHTLYAVAEAVLGENPMVSQINIVMPNRHCLLVDLTPFGQDNPNAIFVPTDEPHGYIEATVKR
jgi:urate oxidase